MIFFADCCTIFPVGFGLNVLFPAGKLFSYHQNFARRKHFEHFQTKISAVFFIVALLSAVVFTGGCGGGGNSLPGVADNEDPKNYSSQIAERLIARSEIYSLQDFVKDSSLSIDKGKVLLWYPEDGEDIRSYPNLLKRLNDALTAGAILAFVNIPAGDIDYFTNELALNLPNYLPDDATSEDKAEIEDFYAVAARLDSEDQSIENDYSYFGVDLTSSDKDFTVTILSGDEEIPFNPDDYTLSPDVECEYVDEYGNVLSEDPNPMKYDYVTHCVDSFLEWVKDMNSLKALSEAGVSSSAEESTTIFPGVSTTFTPTLHVEPRNIRFSTLRNREVTHKAWHRDTSMTFNIMPVHRFSDGADFYLVRVTGNTDPSQQYAHLSFMSPVFGRNKLIDGMTRDKPGALLCDNIVGYNYKFQYTAQLMASPKISGDKVTGTPVGTLHLSAPDTINNSRKVTKGFKFTLDGGITGGASAKDGIKGDISIKPKWEWESKEEYTVTDYQCANISGGDKAGWKWEFLTPRGGPQGFGGVWLDDVALSGRSSVNLKSEFVIMVSKADWKKYPSLNLVVEFKSSEGATEGGGSFYFIGNSGRKDWSYDWSKSIGDYTLPRPPHIAVTQAKFDFKATSAKGDTQVVMLQSEEDWTAKTNASWIHLTTSDNNTKTENGVETLSGNATGSSQKQIMISVDPVTDGKPRGGKIVFTTTDSSKETCVIDILQAGK